MEPGVSSGRHVPGVASPGLALCATAASAFTQVKVLQAAGTGRLHYPDQNVRNCRLRREGRRLRGRHGRAAPDGVPRLRLVGNRAG